ncbi:MAG: two-component regulator propeller domain-containing protein, partial [Flavobacteriaceae bacterium]
MTYRTIVPICLTLLLSVIFISCNGQVKNKMPKDSIENYGDGSKISANDSSIKELERTNQNYGMPLLEPQRLSDFVRRIFQDKQGNLWFGTNGDGVIRFDGSKLEYFAIDEGFGGIAVRGIVEDKHGNIWFGTEQGLTKFDGRSFTNFT